MRKLRSRVAECGDESDKVVEPETEAASPGKLARVAGLPAKIRRTQEETSWDPQPLKLTEIYACVFLNKEFICEIHSEICGKLRIAVLCDSYLS